MNLKRAFFINAWLASMLGIGGASAEAVVIYDFSVVITGGTPNGSPPWATLTISDAGTDTVDLTLTHNASSAQGQFIRKLWLNLDPFPSNPQLIENSPKIVGFTFAQDGIQRAGMIFDLVVDFEASNSGGGVNRLKPGESVSWQITGSGLNENAFTALSGGNPQVPALLHIQGIDGEVGSGHIAPVPEPSSLAGLGLAALALLGRKRRKA